MSISEMGIDAVLQFDSRDYLRDVVQRQLEKVGTHCLDTGGNTIQAGGKRLRASDVTFRYDVTGFSSGSATVTVDVDLLVESGTLETGNGSGSLQATNAASLSMPLTVQRDQSEPRSIEAVVETGLPGSRDVGVLVLDYRNLDAHGASFQPESNPGVVKQLSGGTIAIGLLNDASGTGTSDFVNQFSNDALTGTEQQPGFDDWALVLDHSMVARYVRNMTIQQGNLRNVTLSLQSIGSHLEIDATGEARQGGQWWPFEADVEATLTVANPTQPNSAINVDYHITNAIETTFGMNVTGRLSNNQRNGTETFITPAFLGDTGDPAGRLHVTRARAENGQVVIGGQGTRKTPVPAAVDVVPNHVTIGTGCGGNATSQKVTVKHPKSSDAQVELAVCDVEVGGRDQADFDVNGPAPPVSIAPGSKREFHVRFTKTQLRGTSKATVEIETSSGTVTLPVRAYLDQGTISVPSSVSVTGQQILRGSCVPPVNRARETFSVANTGSGGVEFCSAPKITNQSGGSWSLSAPSAGEVIGPGNSEDITVTFSTNQPERSETASIEIHTSAGRETVSLTGNISEAESGQSGIEAGGIRIGPFMVGAETICLESEKLGVYLEAAEEIMRMIEEILDDWEQPECGPRMLCPDGMGFTFNNFPEGTRIELRDPAVGERAWFEPTGDDGTLVTPVPADAEFELDIEAEEGVDMNKSVDLDVTHGRMIAEETVETDDPVIDLASDGDRLAVATTDGLRVFSMDSRGRLTPGEARKLDVEATGLAAVDDVLIAHGEEEFQSFLFTDQEIEQTGSASLAVDVMIADRNADRERLAFAVQEGELLVLDLDSPSDPQWETVGETTLEEIEQGYAMGNQLALAGTNGVEVWSIRDIEEVDRHGVVELARPKAVFCDNNTAYALTDDYRLAMLRQTDEGVSQVGEAVLPDEWEELRPRGSPAFVGDRAAILTQERDGFTIVRRELSRFGNSESIPESEFDIDVIPDAIIRAASKIGERIEGLYQPKRRLNDH